MDNTAVVKHFITDLSMKLVLISYVAVKGPLSILLVQLAKITAFQALFKQSLSIQFSILKGEFLNGFTVFCIFISLLQGPRRDKQHYSWPSVTSCHWWWMPFALEELICLW